MIVLDCESRESALESVSAIYGIPTNLLDKFLRDFDMDAHYANNAPPRYGDQELRLVFESSLGCTPAPIDRVFWFHLTRARPGSDFANGIQPLSVALDHVWQTIVEVFRTTVHEVRLMEMHRNGVPSDLYQMKVKKSTLGGPYAMLVRAVAMCPREIGNHDYLRLPEIMGDICNGYQDIYGESLHDALTQALTPIIVKFWSAEKLSVSCIESAMYYLYLTAHNRRLDSNANTCFDGKNQAVPSEQIVRVDVTGAYLL